VGPLPEDRLVVGRHLIDEERLAAGQVSHDVATIYRVHQGQQEEYNWTSPRCGATTG